MAWGQRGTSPPPPEKVPRVLLADYATAAGERHRRGDTVLLTEAEARWAAPWTALPDSPEAQQARTGGRP